MPCKLYERRIEGDLAVLFRRMCGFRYLQRDQLPPERACEVWKDGNSQKGTKLVASEETWWSLTKRSTFAMCCALAAFWPKAASEQDCSSVYDFYFPLWHLSSHRSGGVQDGFDLHHALQAQVKWESRVLPPPRSSDAASEKTRVPFPPGDWPLCLWRVPSFPEKFSWVPYNKHEHKAHWLHRLWHRALCQAPHSCSDRAECRRVRSLCWILRNGQQMGTIR